MGDLVVSLVLEKFDCLPKNLEASPASVLVTVFDEDLMPASFRLAAQLRRSGLKVACYPEAAKLSKQFKYGDRMGMRVAIILGPDEQTQGRASIKDLRSGEQDSYPQSEVAAIIRQMLASNPAS
jgi:histidyl-tRNA synthetase